jgi:alanine racemase
MVTLIGEGITVDELAHHFGTIGYEALTSLGKRYARVYKGGDAKAEPAVVTAPPVPGPSVPPAIVPAPAAAEPAAAPAPPPLPT